MKIVATNTPATREAFAAAVVRAWWHVLQTQPTHDSILTLVAQSAFETGWWKKMWCNNPGNAKSLQRAGDWYFIRCTEYIDPAHAEAMLSAAGKTVDGVPNVELGVFVNFAKPGAPPRMKRHVTLLPDHSGACFRAFPTLDAGVLDHFSLVVGQYASAFEFLVRGDTYGFIKALGAATYYTDSFEHYFSTVDACKKMLKDLVVDLSPPPPAQVVPQFSLQNLTWSIIDEDLDRHGNESDSEENS